MNKRIIIPIATFFILCLSLSASEWQKKQAPLMTTWGENIDSDNVLPEYPRPQMVRSDWMNLNGIWDFARGTSNDTYNVNRTYNEKILVPFPVESALSGIMDADHNNANKNYWYKTKFSLDDRFKNKDVLLHFGAVDWQCQVFVNGTKVGVHEGGYDAFSFNISSYLTNSDEQELVVRVYDAQWAGGFPHGKQSLNPNGIWYMPVTGIWQTVWLEPVAKKHIHDFHIIPDVDKSSISIKVTGANTTNNTKALIKIIDGETVLSETTIPLNSYNDIPINAPKLWSPNNPFLYDLEIILKEDETTLDEVQSYFGMRKVHLGKNGDIPYIFLNDKSIFQFGVLDQGWWPDGLYTAPSDEALIFDLQLMKDMGFNTVRKHVKTEPARWYYHCDRLGLMVWQDIPNATTNTNKNAWVETNFIREMTNIINSYKNSPSITTWVVFNEGWGQYDRNDQIDSREPYTRKAVAEAIRLNEKDKRIINGASGWFDYEIGDMIDKHIYPAPGMWSNPVNHRASVCGEYGGVNLKIDGHIWAGSEVNYQTVKDSEELTTQFIRYAGNAEDMRFNGLCGAIYTQITDVESEINGLVTYDRKVVKFNANQISRVKESIEKCYVLKTYNTVLPSSRGEGYEWKYATRGTSKWFTTDFDDSAWAVGEAGFGAGNVGVGIIRTPWETTKIYLRRTFYLGDISEDAMSTLAFEALHDEGCSIYINGVLAGSALGYTSYYSAIEMTPEGKAALKKNDYNLIAVECLNSTGGQFIDVGIVTEGEYVQTDLRTIVDDNDLCIFPNPTSDFFFINKKHSINKVDILTLNGTLVSSYKNNREKYDTTYLEEGIYLLKLFDKDGNVYIEKLIKRVY